MALYIDWDSIFEDLGLDLEEFDSRILNVSSQSPSTYQFGVDLSDAVLKEVAFLKEIDKHHTLYGGPLLKQAIFRYEKLWLPFAAKHKNQTLAAPLDISWVWHCHMLAPRCYVKDCLNICGVIVDHSLTPTCDKETVQQRWSEAYPDHPYNVDVSNKTTYIDVASSISKLGYNLEEAASRQKVFYYQVSLPHYQDTKFIESAIGRYRKFLELKQCYPTFFIVPCYDVDVVWHAHQLHPVTYKEDTKVLLREHFNHDDSVNDRSPGSKLNVSDSETRTIWRKKYGENFASFGAMFRGLPPNGKLHKMSLEKMIIQYPKKVSIVIQQVHIADESVAKKTRSLEFIGILKSGTELKLLKMKKPAIGKGMWNADTHVQEKRELDFDTGMCETFTVALYKKGLFGNMGPKNIVGKASLDILRFINNCKAVNVTENQTVELTVGSTNVRLDFDLTIVKFRDISYTFSPGTYEECIMPEFLEDLWGPVPLTRLPKGQDNKCNVASHRLRTTNGTVEFTVRTIHSLPCLMSVVQVFYHDKLSVVCHLIGPDTLPRRDQVTKKTKLTLTPSKGERAVVIKNNDGDWAVLTGNWTGLRKGIPGKPGRRGIPGSPGHLKISLYKMATGKWTRLSLKNWNNTKDFSFTLDGVHVDMNLNLIKCSATEGGDPEVPENLGLALSILLLHVLCQPRPSDWEARKSLTPAKKATRGGRAIRHLAVEDYGLMLGMGLFVPTPCNHYLRHRYMGVRSHGSYVAGAFREDQSLVMEEALAGYYTEGIHNDTAGDDEPAGCGGCGGCGGGGMWGGYGEGGWSGGGGGGSYGDSDDGGGPGYSGGRGGGDGGGDGGSYDSSDDDDDYGGGGGDGGGGGGDDWGGGGDSGGGGGSCGGGDGAGDSGGDDGGGDSGGGGFDSGGGGGGGCGGGGCGGGGCGGCGG